MAMPSSFSRSSPLPPNDAPVSSSSSSSSDLSPTRFDAQEDNQEERSSAPAESLTLRRKPCVITWSCEHDHPSSGHGRSRSRIRSLSSGLVCDIRYDGASRAAFIKFQIPVLLRTENDATTATRSLYLAIPAENITSLCIGEDDTHEQGDAGTPDEEGVIQEVTSILRNTPICLRFSLSSPPILIALPHDIVPADTDCSNTLLSLHSLAAHTSFRVYISQRSIPRKQQLPLQNFCKAASGRGLASSGAFAVGNTVRSLYNGKGGRVVDISSYSWIRDHQYWAREAVGDVAPAGVPEVPYEAAAQPESTNIPSCPPPSYNAQPPPPLVPNAGNESPQSLSLLHATISRPTKRRRSSSACRSEERPGPTTLSLPLDKQLLQLKTELQEELRRDVFLQLGVMEERLHRRLEDQFSVQRALLRGEFRQEVHQLEERLMLTLEDDRCRLEKDLDYREQEIGCAVDEQLLTCKIELEDQFKDERKDIEETIEEKFEESKQWLQEFISDELVDAKESLTRRFSSASAVIRFDLQDE